MIQICTKYGNGHAQNMHTHRICMRAEYACAQNMHARRMCMRAEYACAQNMRAPRICMRAEYACAQNMYARRICMRAEYACAHNMHTRRICEYIENGRKSRNSFTSGYPPTSCTSTPMKCPRPWGIKTAPKWTLTMSSTFPFNIPRSFNASSCTRSARRCMSGQETPDEEK